MRLPSHTLFAGALVLALAWVGAPAGIASADVTHVVQRGHTLEAIAHRYHVSVKAIVEANHLKDTKHLRVGQELVIPGVEAAGGKGRKGAEGEKAERERAEHEKKAGHTPEGVGRHENIGKIGGTQAHGAARTATTAVIEEPVETRGRRREGEGDSVYAVRLGEEFHIRVRDVHGHIPGPALRAFERLMRQGNATHPPDPRLVALVGIVSNHFGGKPIEVVSGYRAYTPTQYTPHSNHNYGKALDFRVRGVRNEMLRDFCRTLRSAGVGYYPNSSFVHLDVRETKAYWVDWSHPGEPPKYDRADVPADEGASDVPTEGAVPETEKNDAPAPMAPR